MGDEGTGSMKGTFVSDQETIEFWKHPSGYIVREKKKSKTKAILTNLPSTGRVEKPFPKRPL